MVVVHAQSNQMVARFKQQGIQVAGGVPFKINEQAGLVTFRIGLFGLDKLRDIDGSVSKLRAALENMAKAE